MNLYKVKIETSNLLIRPISFADAEFIFREFNEQVTTYLPVEPSRQITETESFIRNARERLQRGSDLNLVIIKQDSQEFCGCAGLNYLKSKHPHLGIWIKKTAQGRGYGFEAISALKKWAEANLDYQSLIYLVDKNNLPGLKISNYLGGKLTNNYQKATSIGKILDILEYQIPLPDTTDKIWQNQQVATTFLNEIRSAVPLATEQIKCILRIIRLTQSQVSNFLDLGCGNGILGKSILENYPTATGVFLDFSETMLEAAQNNCQSYWPNCQFILQDFGETKWPESIGKFSPFNVIVSGFAIHHQPEPKKKEIYKLIYQLLQPGGIFLNLEHVASLSFWGENASDEILIEQLYYFYSQQGKAKTKAEVMQEYSQRLDKAANILAPVESQCSWLREIGFVEVDCFLKLFEIALFGGLRPLE